MARSLSAEELERYNLIPRHTAERVRVHKVPFLAPGAEGMALGHHVLLRTDDTSGTSTLLAHELVHVQQWSDQGTAGFLRSYIADYFRGLRKHRNHRSAYLDIPQEREARTATEVWHRTPPDQRSPR